MLEEQWGREAACVGGRASSSAHSSVQVHADRDGDGIRRKVQSGECARNVGPTMRVAEVVLVLSGQRVQDSGRCWTLILQKRDVQLRRALLRRGAKRGWRKEMRGGE